MNRYHRRALEKLRNKRRTINLPVQAVISNTRKIHEMIGPPREIKGDRHCPECGKKGKMVSKDHILVFRKFVPPEEKNPRDVLFCNVCWGWIR
jgi:hypothetical protein